MRKAFFIILLFIMLLGFLYLIFEPALADWQDECDEAYAICSPGDHVNIRFSPNKKQEPIGYLEPGDKVWLDGRKKNGYVHCIGLTIEGGEGWVFAGYLVGDKPECMNRTATINSPGRLAARKYVNGKRTRWLKSQAKVKVYCWSDDWCLTNCGYVMTRYLDLEGE